MKIQVEKLDFELITTKKWGKRTVKLKQPKPMFTIWLKVTVEPHVKVRDIFIDPRTEITYCVLSILTVEGVRVADLCNTNLNIYRFSMPTDLILFSANNSDTSMQPNKIDQ